MTCFVQITINYEANFSLSLSFLLAWALFRWLLTWKRTWREKMKGEKRRRIAKLIFLWLLLDYVCLLLLLSAHISYLSGAKLYFPVSLCAQSFSLFECGMPDGNFSLELWFKFMDVSTESFFRDFVVLWMLGRHEIAGYLEGKVYVADKF